MSGTTTFVRQQTEKQFTNADMGEKQHSIGAGVDL